MKAARQFISGLFSLPWYQRLWIAALWAFNFVIPWFFLRELEAQLVLGVFVVNTITMIALCALCGFTRILSLAHVLWFPLIYFLWVSLPEIPLTTPYGIWLRTVMAINALCLVLDAGSVIRFALGKRETLA